MDNFAAFTLGDLFQGGGLLVFAYMVYAEVKEMRALFANHMRDDANMHASLSRSLGSIEAKVDVLVKHKEDMGKNAA